MKLTISHRIKIMSILPEKPETFLKAAIRRDLFNKLDFQTQEIKDSEINVDPEKGTWTWNPNKDEAKEFDLDADETDFIQESVKEAEEKDGVDGFLLHLAEKFGVFEGRGKKS